MNKKLLISLVVAANLAFACFAMREAFGPFFSTFSMKSCCSSGHHDNCHKDHDHEHEHHHHAH